MPNLMKRCPSFACAVVLLGFSPLAAQPAASRLLPAQGIAGGAAAQTDPLQAASCDPTDSDGDGVLDDGDCSAKAGDNPCTSGTASGCDDNCRLTPNNQSDADFDGVGDACDNCTQTGNGPRINVRGDIQSDSDFDGYGNACDADFNNDGIIDILDFSFISILFNVYRGYPLFNPDVDTNRDGRIELGDFKLWSDTIFSFPGPSGLACAGTAGCQAPEYDGAICPSSGPRIASREFWGAQPPLKLDLPGASSGAPAGRLGAAGQAACNPADSDGDGILDDGDCSGQVGDAPCATTSSGCDDNCILTPNADQEDSDFDGVGDLCDNCVQAPNGPFINRNGDIQRDTDLDGFGNVCDADVSNDSVIDFFDILMVIDSFNSFLGSPLFNPDADFDNDNFTGWFELKLVLDAFTGLVNDSSGLACAGKTVPCQAPEYAGSCF